MDDVTIDDLPMDGGAGSGMDSSFALADVFILAVVGVFLALGIAAIIATARRRSRHSALLENGVRDTATVVDNRVTSHSGTEGSSSLTFQAVVVLDHQDDAAPVVLPDPSPSSYVLGTKIDVVYDPADPARVEAVERPGVAGYVIGALITAAGVAAGLIFISVFDPFSSSV